MRGAQKAQPFGHPLDGRVRGLGGREVEAMRKDKVIHVRVMLTEEMRSVGAWIIDRFDPFYESSLDVAEQVFLAMLERQRVPKRETGSAPKKARATKLDSRS